MEVLLKDTYNKMEAYKVLKSVVVFDDCTNS